MRTLDDIIPPSRRPQSEGAAPPPAAPGPRMQMNRPRGRFPLATVLVAALVVVVAVAALFYFSKAEVEVTPNTASVAAAGSYTATASGSLPFSVITATLSDTKQVAASGVKTVNASASGQITISSTDPKAVTLIKNTRFETPTGLVYRIHAAVTIPANGSKAATVYADQPGAGYNIGPSSFTIPGLSGTPQFNEITAKSSGAIAGGASGQVPIVSAADQASAQSAIEASLAPELASAIAAKVPSGYLLLSGATAITYQAVTPIAASTSGEALVGEAGTISAVVFPNAALAAAIATLNQSSYDAEPVSIRNASALTLTPAGSFPSSSDQAFTFSLSGTADLLSTVDPNQVAAAIAGKSRGDAQVALTNFPAIKQAVLILRPFWKSTFPEDPSRIKVVVESPE